MASHTGWSLRNTILRGTLLKSNSIESSSRVLPLRLMSSRFVSNMYYITFVYLSDLVPYFICSKVDTSGFSVQEPIYTKNRGLGIVSN